MSKRIKMVFIALVAIPCMTVCALPSWMTHKKPAPAPAALEPTELSYMVVSREGILLSEIYSDGQVVLKEGSAALTIVRLVEIRANQSRLDEEKLLALIKEYNRAQERIKVLQKALESVKQ